MVRLSSLKLELMARWQSRIKRVVFSLRKKFLSIITKNYLRIESNVVKPTTPQCSPFIAFTTIKYTFFRDFRMEVLTRSRLGSQTKSKSKIVIFMEIYFLTVICTKQVWFSWNLGIVTSKMILLRTNPKWLMRNKKKAHHLQRSYSKKVLETLSILVWGKTLQLCRILLERNVNSEFWWKESPNTQIHSLLVERNPLYKRFLIWNAFEVLMIYLLIMS